MRVCPISDCRYHRVVEHVPQLGNGEDPENRCSAQSYHIGVEEEEHIECLEAQVRSEVAHAESKFL